MHGYDGSEPKVRDDSWQEQALRSSSLTSRKGPITAHLCDGWEFTFRSEPPEIETHFCGF